MALQRALSRSMPVALQAAATIAANPEALEASPEAVGKLLLLSMRALASSLAIARTWSSTLMARVLGLPSATLPFSTSSSSLSVGSNVTVVSVRMGSSVSEMLGTAGRFSATSLLPQYFDRAMLARAIAVARLLLMLQTPLRKRSCPGR